MFEEVVFRKNFPSSVPVESHTYEHPVSREYTYIYIYEDHIPALRHLYPNTCFPAYLVERRPEHQCQ